MFDDLDLITELVIETFRLNGDLLASGDRLVADVGLTSARWQVLGAVELSQVPLSVAHTARNMGLSRQAVQRVADELAEQGFVAYAPNPHHVRAKLVVLTEKGKRAYRSAMALQRPWARKLRKDLSAQDVRIALKVMRAIRGRLKAKASIN